MPAVIVYLLLALRVDTLLVLVQIRFLGEGLTAVALKWPLQSVDPQVVEKVVPLPEVFIASVVFAVQNLDISLGNGVLEFVDVEGDRVRNLLLYLETIHVKVFAADNINLSL